MSRILLIPSPKYVEVFLTYHICGVQPGQVLVSGITHGWPDLVTELPRKAKMLYSLEHS